MASALQKMESNQELFKKQNKKKCRLQKIKEKIIERQEKID